MWRLRLIGTALAASLLLPSYAAAQPQGVIIGISGYKSSRSWGPIHGAEDAFRLRDVLVKRFGSDPEKLFLLTNEEATLENISASLERLARQVSDGDNVLVYYSGHGSAVEDEPDGDEEDGLDECLVPYDAPSHRSKSFPDSVLRDDYFRSLVTRLASRVGPAGQVTLIFDCCHSGTMDRAAVGQLEPKSNRQIMGSEDGSMQEDYPETVAVLSACQAKEVAMDDWETEGGLFTSALLRALEEPRLGESSDYRFLMSRIRANGRFMLQNPRFDGNWRLPVLGGEAQPVPLDGHLISSDGWVDRGELAGFYAGTRVSVGEIKGEVVEATPWKSLIKFEAPPEQNLVGKRVQLVQQSSGPPGMKVYIAEGEFELPGDVVEAPSAEEADVIVREVDGQIELLTWKGVSFRFPPSELSDWLKRLSVREYLVRLVHRPAAVEIELEPGKFEKVSTAEGFKASPSRLDSDGMPLFRPGEQVRARVLNRSSEPMWIELLNFAPDGHVVSLLSSGAPLPPGESLTMALSFEPTRALPEGLKVIGSRDPLDLSGATTRSTENPLSRFLRGQLRGEVEQTDLSEPESYVVSDTVFVRCEP